MPVEATVFSQFLDYLPRHEFNTCVRRHRGDRRLRRFSCRDHFLALAFAQLTYRESLRDIVTCLQALGPKLYHTGFRGRVARSTLADTSGTHPWEIFADFAQVLIRQARDLYADDPFGVTLTETVYALDSPTIDLCLSVFPWARFRRRKAAIKLHTLLYLRGNIPCFIHISQGKLHDVHVLDTLPVEAGAFYVMDRGYLDFRRLHRLAAGQAFFVIRGKCKLDFRRTRRRPVDKTTGLRSDSTIRLNGVQTAQDYVLVAIVKKRLKIDRSLSAILQILSLSLFEKMPLIQAFSDENSLNSKGRHPNQPSLFDL